MNQRLSTRALVEGALMTALTVILCLLGIVPVIGAVAMIFYGIPITIVTIHYGKFTGALSAILSVIIVGLFLGPITAVVNGLEGILLGWVIGMMIHNHKSGNKTISAILMVSVFSAIAVLIIDLALMGFSPTNMDAFMETYRADMMEAYNEFGMMDMMTQSMEQQGMSAADITLMMENALLLSIKLLPAMSILGRMLLAMLIYVLTLFVLKRLKIRIPRMPKLNGIHLPFTFVWALITVWAGWLLSTYVNVPALSVVSMNLIAVCGALVLVDGISLAIYWIRPKEMSLFMKIMIGIMTIMCFSGAFIAALFIGLADLLFDFRKKKRDNKSNIL